jgi:sulfoacetaldehyde acetyltransferase
MPARAMVSTDIGNICSVSNSYLRFDAPRSMFAAMSFGNCGYAFPTIVGAKLAAPDRPAIAYVGDGAWGMSFGELQTCVRENIPVTAVVFNNGQWGAEKKNHVDFYDNRFVEVRLTVSGKVVVLTDVPQGACPNCGSRVYKAEVLERIESLMKGQKVRKVQ